MKIYSIVWSNDITIVPEADRWYRIPHAMTVDIVCDCGRYQFNVDKDFRFDARSGGPLVDFITPNLGRQEELKCYFLHDILAYDVGLSFDETNYALYFALRNYAGYGWWRAKTIQTAVSLSDSWFGEPKEGDREYVNYNKIHSRLYDR